jgi:WD40 repeat protein
MNDREKTILRYISALEAADFHMVTLIWQQAENNSELLQALLEIHREMKGHTTMIPYPISRQINTSSAGWLRVAIAILIAAGVIMLALYTAESPVRTTPLQQGDAVITADNADQLEIVQTLGKGFIEGAQWSPDGETLMLYGTGGFWFFDGVEFDGDPVFVNVGWDVSYAEYTEDGNQIIYNGREGVTALTISSGESKLLISVESHPVVSFDYNDGLIGFIDAENQASVWDIERKRPLYFFPPRDTVSILDIKLSEDGQYAALAAIGQVTGAAEDPWQVASQITVVDLETGQIAGTLTGMEGTVQDIDFYENKIIGSVEGDIYMWRINDPRRFDQPEQINLSPDYDLPEQIELPHNHFIGLDRLIRYGDGFFGLQNSLEKPLFRYSPDEGTVEKIEYGHPIRVPSAFAVHPDGKRVAVVNGRITVHIVDIPANFIIKRLSGYWNDRYRLMVTKGDVVAAVQTEVIDIYNLRDGEIHWTVPGQDISTIEFSEDEAMLVFSEEHPIFHSTRNVKLWYYEERRGQSIVDTEFSSPVILGPDENLVYYVDGRMPGGLWLQAYDRDEDLFYTQLWKVSDDQDPQINDIVLSPDQAQIALSNGSMINLYDIEQRDVVQTIAGQPYTISELAYSPDGRWLASVDSLGTLIFHETTTWLEAALLRDVPGLSITVSPVGGLVVTADEQSIVMIDTITFEVISEIPTPGPITDIAFSDDGTRLIGASYNGKIYVWGLQ